ncbi:NADH-quinone oxidoreductase subunit J [Psychrobacter aestuarii]|uniref:NADH-quinone oxidoreductase subunit J n=1 Tax=Psychrobacter aestuarii TaxID=556327 RepID=A0ABN0W0C6_9GAMM|nr:NADH-quinone oxidoreductase subunit J [Psychrobacter aestuarii]
MMEFFNNPDLVGFYSLAAVAIFASLRVVIHANPVHAILSMIVSLLAVAGIFFILGAPFAGALEIVVYAGAILVLFVFVIMMLNLGMDSDAREERWLDAKTWAVPTGLTLIIAIVLYAMIGLQPNESAMIGGATVPAKAVGVALFGQYVMIVEVAALLLLAALVAAYHLGKKSLDDANDYDEPAKAPTPYEYELVDPKDYVGKSRKAQKESE